MITSSSGTQSTLDRPLEGPLARSLRKELTITTEPATEFDKDQNSRRIKIEPTEHMAEGGPISAGGLAGPHPAQQGRPITTQQTPVGSPTSPPLSISPPPPATSKAMPTYVAAPLTTGSIANCQSGGTWPYGKPWPPGAVTTNNQGHHTRRASTGCDVNRDGVSGGPVRSKGTRKGRFHIRDLPPAASAIAESRGNGGATSSATNGVDDDEFAIPIVQDGKLVPSPLSTPRARLRTRTEGDPCHEAHPGRGAGGGEASNAADGASFPSASAAAGAAAAAAAVVTTAATVGAEPVKRQRGRFKLRDIGEVSSSTLPPSGSGGGGVGCAVGQQQQQVAATGSLGPAPVPSVNAENSSGTGVAAPAAAQFAQLDVKATMLLLEQNRQMLERLAVIVPDPSSSAGLSPISAAPNSGASAASSLPTENRQPFANNNHPLGADRGRTVSMSALTLPTPLPPKPPSCGGISADRNGSPLMRDTPASWWGSQQGQAQAQAQGQGGQSGVTQGGQPPRRPSSAGLAGRNSDATLGGPAAPGGGGGLQGVVGGGLGAAGSGGGATMLGSAARAKDDGTGRRAERGRLSTLLDQLKDEIEFHANARRDMDLELKLVRQRYRLMEERAEDEKSKATAAEARASKLQARVRALTEENTQLRQILQQIQDSGLPLLNPSSSSPGQQQPQQNQQQSQHQHQQQENNLTSGPSSPNQNESGSNDNGNTGSNALTPALSNNVIDPGNQGSTNPGAGGGMAPKHPANAAVVVKQTQQSQTPQHNVQAPAQGMWIGSGSLQQPHNPLAASQGGGPARGPPLGVGHANRISPAAAGLEHQRSPQRRRSSDQGAEAPAKPSLQHWRRETHTGVLGSGGIAMGAAQSQGAWQGQTWSQGQGMGQGLGVGGGRTQQQNQSQAIQGGQAQGQGAGRGPAQAQGMQGQIPGQGGGRGVQGQGMQGMQGQSLQGQGSGRGQGAAPPVPQSQRTNSTVPKPRVTVSMHAGGQQQQQQLQQQPAGVQAKPSGMHHRRTDSGERLSGERLSGIAASLANSTKAASTNGIGGGVASGGSGGLSTVNNGGGVGGGVGGGQPTNTINNTASSSSSGAPVRRSSGVSTFAGLPPPASGQAQGSQGGVGGSANISNGGGSVVGGVKGRTQTNSSSAGIQTGGKQVGGLQGGGGGNNHGIQGGQLHAQSLGGSSGTTGSGNNGGGGGSIGVGGGGQTSKPHEAIQAAIMNSFTRSPKASLSSSPSVGGGVVGNGGAAINVASGSGGGEGDHLEDSGRGQGIGLGQAMHVQGQNNQARVYEPHKQVGSLLGHAKLPQQNGLGYT